jgi:hypothetical protein
VDRIAALRNVEDALAAFERGETDLAATEQRVLAVLRTYATEFDDLDAYRARGEDPADGVVVAAESRPQARERVLDVLDADGLVVDADDLEFELEQLG